MFFSFPDAIVAIAICKKFVGLIYYAMKPCNLQRLQLRKRRAFCFCIHQQKLMVEGQSYMDKQKGRGSGPTWRALLNLRGFLVKIVNRDIPIIERSYCILRSLVSAQFLIVGRKIYIHVCTRYIIDSCLAMPTKVENTCFTTRRRPSLCKIRIAYSGVVIILI